MPIYIVAMGVMTADLLREAMKHNNNDDIRLHISALFSGVYDIAHQVGANLTIIEAMEITLIQMLLEARRHQRLGLVTD